MRRADAPPPSSLEGQFLIAMPSLREGPFARSVVYMCAHREDGAMGIIINQRAEEIDFGKLLVQLEKKKFNGVTPELRENILSFYDQMKTPDPHGIGRQLAALKAFSKADD